MSQPMPGPDEIAPQSEAPYGLSAVQLRVLAFATAQLNLKPRQAVPDARLLHDLGLSGSRAKAFIHAFSREFNVNCDALLARDEWSRYFGPERFPRRLPIFLCVSLIVTGMILGGQLDAQWLWLLVAVGIWLARSKAWPLGRGKSDMLPISLLDLAEAVEQGEWTRSLR